MSAATMLFAASATAQVSLDWRIHAPGNTGIPGDTCSFVWLDEQDHPWVSAYTVNIWGEFHGGLGYHDGTQWRTISNMDHPQIASPIFNDMARDSHGILWIATDFGLLRLDRAVGPQGITRFDQTNSPMIASQIQDLAIAPDDTIWLAINDVDGVPSGGLVKFDPAANTWQTWTAANGFPWGSNPDWALYNWVDQVAVVPDPTAASGYSVWFSQYEQGACMLRDGQFTWFGNLPMIVDANPPLPLRLPSDNCVDAQGNLWLLMGNGTYARRNPDGTYHYAGAPPQIGGWSGAALTALSGGHAVIHTQGYQAQKYDNGWSALPDWGGAFSRFAEDSTGALWVAGIGGAAKFVNGAWQRHRFTNSSMLSYFIKAIEFAPDGRVFINGNASPGVGGFNIFDGVNWTGVNDFNHGLGPAWGMPSDDTMAFCMRASGSVALIPTGQAVYDWNGSTYTQLIPAGYDPRRVVEDGLGRLWAPRANGWGLMLIAGKSFSEFYPGNSPMPNGSEVMAVIPQVGAPGFVWLAHQLGLAYTNGVSWTMYTRPQIGVSTSDTGYIRCADRAPDGSFWLGTDGEGLVRFDPATGQHTAFNTSTGALPTNYITNVEVAPDGSVWVASMSPIWPYPGGLSHFENGVWMTYTEANSPLPNRQNGCLASRSVAGGGYELWVGTFSEGIAVITAEPPIVTGDVNGDGQVNVTDLLAVITSWGNCPPLPANCSADVNHDGLVNVADLLMVITNWG